MASRDDIIIEMIAERIAQPELREPSGDLHRSDERRDQHDFASRESLGAEQRNKVHAEDPDDESGE